MGHDFDFESFKAAALEQMKAGKPLTGRDGVLAPLLENNLLNGVRRPNWLSPSETDSCCSDLSYTNS